MRVKVLVTIDIDTEKQNQMRTRIESIIAQKKAKSGKLCGTFKRYYIWVYQDDPLLTEILDLSLKITEEYKRKTEIMKDEEGDKIQKDLYEAFSKKLKSMQAKGKSDYEIVLATRSLKNKIEKFAEEKRRRHEERAKICEEMDSGCYISIGYNPEYTEADLQHAIGYTIVGKIMCEVADDEEKFLAWCEECKRYTKQKGFYVLKSNRRIKQSAQEKRVFSSDDGRATFVTEPMYQYLLENGIAPEYFRPAYFDHKKKKLAGYQLVGRNILPKESFIDFIAENGEKCKGCGKFRMRFLHEDSNYIFHDGYHNSYIDCDKVKKWGDINVARYEQAFSDQELIFSSRMLELLKKADKQLLWGPIFPLSAKDLLECN